MAILSPEKYYKKPEESVAEYNARVAAESRMGDTGYASLTQGQKDLLSSVPLKGETAILGTPSAKNNFETKIQPKIDAANNSLKAATEIITNPKTKPTLEESIIPSELLDEGKTPEEIEQEKLEKQQKDNWEKQQTNIEETYKGLTTVQTTSAQNQIAGLTKQWQERKNLMEKSNKAALAGFTQYFQRTGGAEYSPLITQEFISTKEQEGIDRLTEIDNEYNAKIGEINNALSNNLFSVAAAKTKDLLALEEKSIQQMKENTKAAKEVNDKLKENKRLGDIASFSASLMKKGRTDPKDIIEGLNKLGVNATSDDIKKVMDAFNVETKDAENIGKVYQSALNMGAPQNVLDSILSSKSASEAYKSAGGYAQNAGGIIGEYNKYKLEAIEKGQSYIGFNDFQTVDANRKAKAAASATGLDSGTLTKVQTIANQFDSEQAVKNYQTSAEAIDAMKSAGISPTDDISRIYAFAKVMDPNSVVREGEYATVQEYSTALLERFGLKTKRVFDNSGFLTDEARKFLLTTLENRLKSSQKAFDNIYSEYGRRIDKITGTKDGKDYLTNYSKPFVSTGDEIIKNETDAETSLTKYMNSNPDKQEEINQRISDAEIEAGRPITSQEFLQIYPEYK